MHQFLIDQRDKGLVLNNISLKKNLLYKLLQNLREDNYQLHFFLIGQYQLAFSSLSCMVMQQFRR